MGYRLAEQNGESVAVPRLVFAHLARADGDTIRAALYLLGGGGTDPRTMARDLGMPSIEAAKRAMQYWAGAGLLVSDRDAPLPKTEMQKASAIDLTTLNDPYVSVLCEEAQQQSKGLPQKDARKGEPYAQKPETESCPCRKRYDTGRFGRSRRRFAPDHQRH